MFHLGWFVTRGFSIQSWNETWSGAGAIEWAQPDLYVDLARALERACFDCMIFEDTSHIPDVYGGSMEYALSRGERAPKHDPICLIPLIGQATTKLGIAATISTSFYPPFLLARLMSTLDHLTGGRVGCNLVTSGSERAAQNYGLDTLTEHDLRYEMAQEWIDVVSALWSSWEPDAVVLDYERGVYADYTKVHPIDYGGRFHRSRGPLNTIPSPQGRPVIVQAGASPAGRDLAARNADLIIADVPTVEAFAEYREDVHERMRAIGRDAASCKLLLVTQAFLGETEDEARAEHARISSGNLERKLVGMSTGSGVDFSALNLDEPVPEVRTEGFRGVESFTRPGRKSLREIASAPSRREFVGTPDQVAEEMGAAMEQTGGDGFLFMNPLTRRSIAEITDGLVPALQRRGLVRSSYRFDQFRDTLLEF